MTVPALRDLTPAQLAKSPLVARLTRTQVREPVEVAIFNSRI